MQRFYIPFTYKRNHDGGLVATETWCKADKDALTRIHVKLPPLCTLVEAWLVEWQNPDAPMEALFGNKKEPDGRLKEMLTEHRNERMRAALDKAKRQSGKPRVRLKHPLALPPPEKKVVEPYKPFTLWYAISYRDVHWLKEKT